MTSFRYDLEDVFTGGCAGVSSRLLRKTLGGDTTCGDYGVFGLMQTIPANNVFRYLYSL